MRTIRFLLQKEFRQIFRDRTMLRMLLVLPAFQLVVLSSAATFEVREGRVWVVDNDRSETSRALLDAVFASGRFRLVGSSTHMAPADRSLLDRTASVVVRIPDRFEHDLVRKQTAPVQLIFDAEDGAAAGVLHAYLQRIFRRFAADLGDRFHIRLSGVPDARPGAPLDIRHRNWFNPELQYDDYMVPGILVILVTIIAMAITSMNIVREKEIGTLEQLNVTPVTRAQFIAGKLLPFWIIALFDLAVGLVVGWLVFDIPFEGSLVVVFAGAVVYLLVALGTGLFISTIVDTQQQAIFTAFFINMVYLLMSGLFTPVASMPVWAQWAAQLSPVKHYVEIMRTVLIRGGGFEAVAVPLAILSGYGILVLTFSIRQYTKTTT